MFLPANGQHGCLTKNFSNDQFAEHPVGVGCLRQDCGVRSQSDDMLADLHFSSITCHRDRLYAQCHTSTKYPEASLTRLRSWPSIPLLLKNGVIGSKGRCPRTTGILCSRKNATSSGAIFASIFLPSLSVNNFPLENETATSLISEKPG